MKQRIFKVGDKVKRVPNYCGNLFKKDQIYTISELILQRDKTINLGIKGVPYINGYDSNLFVLVEKTEFSYSIY